MSTQLVAFDSVKLPAHIGRRFAVEDDIGSGGFPTISIKGKTWTISRSGEKTMVTKPDNPEEPAGSLEVVILGISPPGNLTAKTFFKDGYVEGSDAKPDCTSLDGISPDAGVPDKQCDKCAICPQAAKGSRPTKEKPDGKACSDSKRVAVAPAGQLNDPMFLRVPAASLKALRTYRELLKTRKVAPQEVVTRMGFVHTEAYPSLTFKPVGFLTPEMLDAVYDSTQSDMVADILGAPHKGQDPAEEVDAETLPQPTKAVGKVTATVIEAEKPAAPVTKKPAGKPMAAAPAVETPKVKAPVQEAVVVDADAGMDAALDALDFDD